MEISGDFHQPIVSTEISKDCLISIVIPVKNEIENITATLTALNEQINLNGQPFDNRCFEIIILANNCTDNSAAAVRSWKSEHPSGALHLAEVNLSPKQANIGYVRRWLMTEAYRRLGQNKFKGGIIMTTDGDTCPASNWISANMREINLGAEAVGGRILIKPEDLRRMSEKARRFHLLDTGYRLAAAEIEAQIDPLSHDPAPRHHQHFNGSFAVTTNAFLRAGGVPPVKFLEDVAFYDALRRVDARIRHSPQVRVQTSSRIAGRTELGLSTQINEWTLMGEKGDVYLVESAAMIIERFVLQKALREIWQRTDKTFEEIKTLADKLLISSDFLENELSKTQTFGVLLENVYAQQQANDEWWRDFPPVCVTRALADLRQILASFRRKNQLKSSAFSQTSSR